MPVLPAVDMFSELGPAADSRRSGTLASSQPRTVGATGRQVAADAKRYRTQPPPQPVDDGVVSRQATGDSVQEGDSLSPRVRPVIGDPHSPLDRNSIDQDRTSGSVYTPQRRNSGSSAASVLRNAPVAGPVAPGVPGVGAQWLPSRLMHTLIAVDPGAAGYGPRLAAAVREGAKTECLTFARLAMYYLQQSREDKSGTVAGAVGGSAGVVQQGVEAAAQGEGTPGEEVVIEGFHGALLSAGLRRWLAAAGLPVPPVEASPLDTLRDGFALCSLLGGTPRAVDGGAPYGVRVDAMISNIASYSRACAGALGLPLLDEGAMLTGAHDNVALEHVTAAAAQLSALGKVDAPPPLVAIHTARRQTQWRRVYPAPSAEMAVAMLRSQIPPWSRVTLALTCADGERLEVRHPSQHTALVANVCVLEGLLVALVGSPRQRWQLAAVVVGRCIATWDARTFVFPFAAALAPGEGPTADRAGADSLSTSRSLPLIPGLAASVASGGSPRMGDPSSPQLPGGRQPSSLLEAGGGSVVSGTLQSPMTQPPRGAGGEMTEAEGWNDFWGTTQEEAVEAGAANGTVGWVEAGGTANGTTLGGGTRCVPAAVASISGYDETTGMLEFTVNRHRRRGAPDLSTVRIFPRQRGALLGRGSFGTVYRGLDLDSMRTVAVKIIGPQAGSAPQEELTLATMQHPHVVECLGVQANAGGTRVVMEYCGGGTLRSVVEKFSPPRRAVRRVLRDAADALRYLHSFAMTHSDVKPDNILLRSDGSAALADFGCAAIADTGERMTVGTTNFMSPEAFEDVDREPPRDVYALAATAVFAFSGRMPWQHEAFYNNAFRTAVAIGDMAKARAEPPPPARQLRDAVVRGRHQRQSSLVEEAGELDPTTAACASRGPFDVAAWRAVPLALRPLLAAALHPLPQCRPTAADLFDGLTASL